MASEGPRNASVFADLAGIGTVAWSNPSNAQYRDSSFATAALPSADNVSHWLKLTGFGFALPSTAVVKGIEAEVRRKCTPGGGCHTNYVYLLKAGVQSASGYTDSAGAWPLGNGDAFYGGATSLWGETWTYSDINNANFGVILSAIADLNGVTAYVDAIRLTVYYQYADSGSETLTATDVVANIPGVIKAEALTETDLITFLTGKLNEEQLIVLDVLSAVIVGKLPLAEQIYATDLLTAVKTGASVSLADYLLALDSLSKVISKPLSDVFTFDFNPNSNKIAFLVGKALVEILSIADTLKFSDSISRSESMTVDDLVVALKVHLLYTTESETLTLADGVTTGYWSAKADSLLSKQDCDVCGFTFYKRELLRRFDGAMVCKWDWEPRHEREDN